MTETQIPAPFTRDVDREIDKLTAEIERLRIEINILFNGLVYIVNVASGEAQRHGLKILRQIDGAREILKEPDDDSLERPASAAKQHVESWPKWKQEAMRREVGIKDDA